MRSKRLNQKPVEQEKQIIREKMLGSRTWFAYGALALVFLSSVSADDVLVLTNDNFHNEVGKDRGALVEFYAPWYFMFSFLRLFLFGCLEN